MTELEQRLTALGRAVDWPQTPELALRVVPRLGPRGRGRRAVPRRGLVLALALLVLAIAVAFAVPSARTAILRFFGLRGVSIERVDRLPPAEERPLGANLGRVVAADEVEREVGFHPLLPPVAHQPTFYVSGGFVSVLLATPKPVLLTEFEPGPGGPSAGALLKKLAGGGTFVTGVTVNGGFGLWIRGKPHVFISPQAPPRLAGNVLLWEHGALTFRLEGRLTLAEALKIAQSIK
jgi:hypothetical protein